LRTLDPADYHHVRRLLEDLMRFNVSIAGVLTGNNPGTVYVDHPDAPTIALVLSPEGAYLAGNTPSADQVTTLKDQLADLMEQDAIDSLWLTCDAVWEPLLHAFLPRPPLPIARQHYICTAPAFDWRSQVPEGFAVHRIDAALLARADLTMPDHVYDWIDNNWGTQANFFTRGLGIATEALDTRTVVSWSLCDCLGDGACEIGIRTHPDYRRQGFAALTAAAAVDAALAQGLREVGWHCNSDNLGSQHTALRVGFTLEREYVTFVTFRQEAVHWAEAGRMQEVAGNYRAAAEDYIRADACEDQPEWGHYLPFYAACAFVRLGDYDAAWMWLERAVARGFDDTATLQSALALKPLQAFPAWDTLVGSIR
jgi:RimJ/RimL family protein N-acetyltransferase